MALSTLPAAPNYNAVDTTISDIKTFVDCRQKWDFGSLMRYGKAPKETAAHFWFGDLFHRALEQYYTGNDDPASWFEQQAAKQLVDLIPEETRNYEKISEGVTYGPKLLRAYVRFAKRVDRFTMVATEQRYTVRVNNLTPGHFFSFKFDGLVLDKNGRYWLKEFKTIAGLPSSFEWLEVDLQQVAYQWAAEQVLGYPVAGTIYTFIRKHNPRWPELLRSGNLSQATNMVTTYDEYIAAIKHHRLDPADYDQTLKRILAAEEHNFFRRVTITASAKQRERAGEQIKRLIEIMADPDVDIYHSPERMKCGFCEFREPCALRLNGHNFKAYLERNYKNAEPRD